jgi:hypothetical protein
MDWLVLAYCSTYRHFDGDAMNKEVAPHNFPIFLAACLVQLREAVVPNVSSHLAHTPITNRCTLYRTMHTHKEPKMPNFAPRVTKDCSTVLTLMAFNQQQASEEDHTRRFSPKEPVPCLCQSVYLVNTTAFKFVSLAPL